MRLDPRRLARRGADKLTITGLLEGERVVWESLMEAFRSTPVVPPTLVFLVSDLKPRDYVPFEGGSAEAVREGLAERRRALGADAVLYGGSRRVDEHKARLSLYTFWHSAGGRRMKMAERVDGVVRELDMSGAKDLSSWVEELF